MKNTLKLQACTSAALFVLSLVSASVFAGILISIIVVVRLTTPGDSMVLQMPWGWVSFLGFALVLLFREAQRTRNWVIQIWDRLRADNRAGLAVSLVESIEDPASRDDARLQLAIRIGNPRSDESNRWTEVRMST
jgi:hypothetical protein